MSSLLTQKSKKLRVLKLTDLDVVYFKIVAFVGRVSQNCWLLPLVPYVSVLSRYHIDEVSSMKPFLGCTYKDPGQAYRVYKVAKLASLQRYMYNPGKYIEYIRSRRSRPSSLSSPSSSSSPSSPFSLSSLS